MLVPVLQGAALAFAAAGNILACRGAPNQSDWAALQAALLFFLGLVEDWSLCPTLCSNRQGPQTGHHPGSASGGAGERALPP